jgi:tetratricopeptide (TPR) repeat protein
VREATRRLHDLMATLQRRYPNDRQRSLLASVELSLRRLPVEVRKKLGPLGAFQGGGTGWAIAQVLELDYRQDEEVALGRHLEAVGLGTLLPIGQGMTYLRLNPALAQALWGALPEVQRLAARAAWATAMRELVDFLLEQRSKDVHLAARLTLLELPNLLAPLAWHVEVAQVGQDAAPAGTPDASAAAPTWDDVVAMAAHLERLLQNLGRQRALASVADIRARTAAHLGTWSRTHFEAERADVERLDDAGRLAEAVAAARTLLQQAQAAGLDAYSGAAYDLAVAHFLLGRMLRRSRDAEAGLELLAEARTGFTALADAGNTSAARMASVCLTESGGCLMALGRLDEAAAAYETAIALGEQRHDRRSVAVNKGQLGTVRLSQRDYPAALAAFTETRETFAQLNEPVSVAVAWHQIGIVHKEAEQYEAAEHAYQASLQIAVQLGDTAGQALTLGAIGILYDAMGRLEDAVRFHRQAAEMHATLHDLAGEGHSRSNAADPLIALRRYDEARRELQRAIACQEPFGHAAKPWKTFGILSDLERAVGNTAAATAAATALAEIAQRPNLPAYVPPGLAALQALLAGSRDPALADDPRLAYDDAVDLRLLLDQLGPA